MRELLLCPPDHYGIEYEINPWMSRARGAEAAVAQKQWKDLHATLSKLNFTIHLVPPQPKLPDMVFTANAGLAVGKKFIPSNFRHKERAGEAPHFVRWMEKHGYESAWLPEGLYFEGEGDALFGGDTLFCGYKFRSDIQSHRAVADILGCLVISVELVDPRFYHLDTCFCPLADGWLMYYPPAFDLASQETITMLVPPEKRIDVGEKDAFLFACNAVDINGRVFMNDASATLQSWVRAAGFKLTLTPLSEFIKAGGAAKCLTLKLVEV
jgi:N-dimethylarginine dimethylaminohydrolase